MTRDAKTLAELRAAFIEPLGCNCVDRADGDCVCHYARTIAQLDALLAAARAEALEKAAKRCGAIRHDLRDEANREGGILPASMRKYHEANGAAACEMAIRALVKGFV